MPSEVVVRKSPGYFGSRLQRALILEGDHGRTSIALGEEKAELQRLKIQLAYEQQVVKDAEMEFEVLRKRLQKSKGKSRRFHQIYREMLLRKKKLEEEVENLKQSLIMARIEISKSEEAELP